MIEIRLCSLTAAEWLTAASLDLPNGLGLTFKRALERRLKELESVEAVKQSAIEGLVIAKEGVTFSTSDLIVSVAHALAYVSPYEPEAPDVADAIESFVVAHGATAAAVPRALKEIGVTAVLEGPVALDYADWIESVDRSEFESAVSEMHGSTAVAAYMAVADSLQQIFSSVRVHGCDLCCLSLR
jgi:hypothetical protein